MHFIALIFIFGSITYNYAQTCEDPKQEWNTCGSACGPPSCLDAFYTGDPPMMCPFVCVARCECKRDQYTLGINDEGCIPIADCPKTIKCPETRIYREKGCPKTCYDRNATCTEIRKGCFCPEGLFEDEKGNCIPEEYCPLGCFGGEIEDNCVSPTCQPTCRFPRPRTCVPFECTKECICSPPLVRNDAGNCVDIDACPKLCKIEGMEYSECGNCQPTCKNYQLLDCPKDCKEGCRCRQGTVLDESRNKCIPPEFCECSVTG